MRELVSTDAVIDTLGGPTAVARLIGDGCTTQRVWNWRKKSFPLCAYDPIQTALAALDCVAAPELWRELPGTLKAQIKLGVDHQCSPSPIPHITRTQKTSRLRFRPPRCRSEAKAVAP